MLLTGLNMLLAPLALQKAVAEEGSTHPEKLPDDTLAFMFESSFTPRVTWTALKSPKVDHDYYKCWLGLRSHFDKDKPEGSKWYH